MFIYLHDSGLASQIRRRRRPVSTKGRNTGCEDNLALDLRHVGALLSGFAEAALQGILDTGVEQL